MQHAPAVQPRRSFRVARDVRGTTQIVTVHGDVDLAGREALTDVIDRAIGLLPARVVVDMTATTFMDSSGVRCLLRAQKHADARQVDLVVIPGPPAARRVLALCGADRQLQLAG